MKVLVELRYTHYTVSSDVYMYIPSAFSVPSILSSSFPSSAISVLSPSPS